MFGLVSPYLEVILSVFLFPFIYFLHHVGQRSTHNRLEDMHGDYRHMYDQVMGIRERLVKLEQEFASHNLTEMEKFDAIRAVVQEIHDVLRDLGFDRKFNHKL